MFHCDINPAQPLDSSDFNLQWIPQSSRPFTLDKRGSGYESEIGLIRAAVKGCSKATKKEKRAEP